jgi:uncharacterized protein YbaR (Trm112 family)
MIDAELLKILCCPETYQTLEPAEPSLIEMLNKQIGAGQLRNRRGERVSERIDGGLVRSDGRFLYPIRQNIPIMLIDEAIPLTQGPGVPPVTSSV